MFTQNVPFDNVELSDGFWKNRYRLNEEESIYAVKKRFEESGRFNALRFIDGNKKMHVYYDSDVAKWIEGVAYLLAKERKKHKDLEAFCDALIKCMKDNQREDGYFNSYFQQVKPDGVFKDRNAHELYCAGHIIEAAIAYDKYVGKGDLLELAEKYVALIRQVFMIEKSAPYVTCGHEEIELALFSLYEYTRKEEYKELANFFIDERGNNALDKEQPIHSLIGAQDNAPARELFSAEGHAVRAVYYYSAMADAARLSKDEDLKTACDRLFEDIVDRKLYITGGIGSTRISESFTVPYDLPNLTAYTESCAAIGLVMFAQRMHRLAANGKYGDLVERILYNGFLSSTSLDGKRFFYENPLEVCRKEKDKQTAVRQELRTVLPIWQRKEVFDCSCCPPNINRFIASIGNLIYSETAEGYYVNQFISSVLGVDTLTIKTNYPNEKTVRVVGKKYPYSKLFVRVPAWCEEYSFRLNGKTVDACVDNGYAALEVGEDFTVEMTLGFSPCFIEGNPKIRDNAGKVCLMNGPVVYCLEEVDNGPDLYALYVDGAERDFTAVDSQLYGLNTFECKGVRKLVDKGNSLYAKRYSREKVVLRFIPYYAFANRGESDMIVWINAMEGILVNGNEKVDDR